MATPLRAPLHRVFEPWVKAAGVGRAWCTARSAARCATMQATTADGDEEVPVDLDEARAFVRENSHAVLMTMRRDGTPQSSPVAATVDAEGRVVVSSRETAYKTRNLRRDPRVWLCVFPDAFYGHWVQVEGEVEVLSLPEAMEPLVEYYRRIAGEHPNWEEYRRAMRDEQRCLLRVSLTRAGPDRAG